MRMDASYFVPLRGGTNSSLSSRAYHELLPSYFILTSLLGQAPYGQALTGLRVLKSDGAIAPRVLKFDSGFAAEGCGGRL